MRKNKILALGVFLLLVAAFIWSPWAALLLVIILLAFTLGWISCLISLERKAPAARVRAERPENPEENQESPPQQAAQVSEAAMGGFLLGMMRMP